MSDNGVEYSKSQRVQVECDILNDRLCDACEIGNYDDVWSALEDGAVVDCRDNEPIRLADENGHLDIVTHLIQMGAKPIEKCGRAEDRRHPFSAEGRKNVEAVVEILSNKKNMNKERKHEDLAAALYKLYSDARDEGIERGRAIYQRPS